MDRIFLIDLENVQSNGLEGIEQLSPEDKVMIFYSDKADNLKIDLIRKIRECRADVDYIHADNGTPNSLDFQLITWLYYSIDSNKEYWIISKDTGYEASIKMAKRLGSTNVHRAPAILNAVHYAQKNAAIKARTEQRVNNTSKPVVKEETAVEKKPEEPVKASELLEEPDPLPQEIHDLLLTQCGLNTTEEEINAVEEALKQSENKNQFYQYFRKHMGAEKGSAFYKQIRSQFNALKELDNQLLPF